MKNAVATGGASDMLARLPSLRARLPGHDLPWLTLLRHTAANRFAAIGLPNRQQEAWKYTDLHGLEEIGFRHATEIDDGMTVARVPSLLAGRPTAARLVFVNGRHHPGLSSHDCGPHEVLVETLQTALSAQHSAIEPYLSRIDDGAEMPLRVLNTAFIDDGCVVRVRRGVRLARPIELVFLGGLAKDAIACHPRHLFVLEAESAATIVESHIGVGNGIYFVNHAMDVHVDRGAELRHYRLQTESPSAFHVTTAAVHVGSEARYEGFGLTGGARLSRFEARVLLEGEGGHCALGGAYLVRGRQHCDNTTVIEHARPRTSCREVFKGVLDECGRGVFQGRIVVQRGAQKSDGRQVSKALLLSPDAEMDAKPELEIYADDVKCSHGATTGQIDDSALFYLRTRGIAEAAARRLLVEAFLADAFQEVADEEVRGAMSSLLGEWMATTREARP